MIADELKIEVSNAIEQLFGLHYPPNQWDDLERRIRLACHEKGMPEFRHFLLSLAQRQAMPDYTDVLINHLTIGETYFFRERTGLDIFIDRIVKPLLESRRDGCYRKLTIWSAGCCSGEEPYTLAMLLREAVEDIDQWQITILGTDINTAFLNKAMRGRYTAWSFRETPTWLRDKYFTRIGSDFQINQEIREMVTFRKLNLLDSNAFPSPKIPAASVDVVFCRNVLMYFSTKQISKVAQRFQTCIQANGWLITSPVEVSSEGFSGFMPVSFSNWIMLQNVPDKERNSKSTSVVSKPQGIISTNNKPQESIVKPVDSQPPKPIIETFKDERKDLQRMFERGQYVDLLDRIPESPIDTDTQYIHVQSLANLNRFDEAKSRCDKYLASNPDPRLFTLSASIELEKGNDKQAENLLRQAIYIDHTYLHAHFLMGNLLRKIGNKKLADKHFDNILKIVSLGKPEDNVLGLEGMTFAKLREYITRIR